MEQFRHKYRTGLVTLLFTDIVGSTKLKQALGDRDAVALMHYHHAAVRGILGEFAGAIKAAHENWIVQRYE